MTDASDCSLGAVLQQKVCGVWKPLAYFSKTMSATQRRYSVYDRELLAIYTAVKHFRRLIEGCEVTIFTDHKPLVHALKRPPSSSDTPKRERQLHFISQFCGKIEYVRGEENAVADALSRVEEIQCPSPIDYEKLSHHQRSDQELEELRKQTNLNFSDVTEPGISQPITCEMSTGKPRPYLPPMYRFVAFKAQHDLCHPGVRATRKQISTKFFWPSMNKDISNWARACLDCQRAKIHRHATTPLGEFPPSERFEHIHIDIGWNDVGFHGSNDVSTPNIDALAYSGLLLQNYYVTPICTPSRAALMTGKYPIHTGMQHGVIYGAEPRGLPLTEKILPQYLKDLGYKTHLVGKWHLGSYKREYLPLNRGFDSHVGFWTGRIDMYDHTSMEHGSWGFDFRRGFKVAHDLFGHYATDVYTNEAIKVIKGHNISEPLFLMVSHSAVHSGNPYEPIRAPQSEVDKFKHIPDTKRQKFAAVLSKMDESIGKVIDALHAQGLLDNSIVIFSTDNGGPAAGFNDNAASNYPLKGVKNTLWEGGVRGAGVLWSPLLEKKSRVAIQRIHIVDWLPTLYRAAGGDISAFQNIDGIDQWESLSKDEKSARTSLLHNIDDIWASAALTVDQWKVHKGTNYNGAWDFWYGPDERSGVYNMSRVCNDYTGRAVQKLGFMPDGDKILNLRNTATLTCNSSIEAIPCQPLQAPCLFNIEDDPCEKRNLAELEPETLQKILEELTKLNKTAIPPNSKPIEPKGDPKNWGRIYTNFGDFDSQHASSVCL